METIRKTELIPVFVEQLPLFKDMEEGKLYISKSRFFLNHLCACGCGRQSPMGIKPEWEDGWDLIEESDGTITVRPSVGNFMGENPYHAHYFITHNKIEWL